MEEILGESWIVRIEYRLAEDEQALLSSKQQVARLSGALAVNGGHATPTLRGWVAEVKVETGPEVFNLYQAAVRGRTVIEGACQRVGLFGSPVSQDAWSQDGGRGPMAVVGAAELAELLGISRQRLAQLRKDGALPPPDLVLAATPLWSTTTVEAFLWGWRRKPGRKPEVIVRPYV